VPVFDACVVQKDRNRNMAYGEVFWKVGLDVYSLTDSDLNETFGVPADHLLSAGLDLPYEYPIVTLLFYAALAAIEPGQYHPSHMIVNIVLLLIAHLNLLMFISLGRAYWDRKWFAEMFGLYYGYELAFSIVFAKTEPLAEMLMLMTLSLWRQRRPLAAGAVLAVAVQVKVYPLLISPFLFAAAPLAIMPFVVVLLITTAPLLLSGQGYDALVSHLLNSRAYSPTITNPFYVGLVFQNPLSVLAPLALVIGYLYCVLETTRWHGIPVPLPRLRVRDWRAIAVFALPLLLMGVSWVLIWYYSWFVVPMFIIEDESSLERYPIMMASLWVAHIVGILVNLPYFLSGPIADFVSHFKG